jgi:Flp pilus assembly protein TadD
MGQIEKRNERLAEPRTTLMVCFGLYLLTLAVYWQTSGFAFLNYDDPDYVTGNAHVREGVTMEGIAWAFSSLEAANWFPVTRISHMVDYQLFGLNSGAHHLINGLLHSLAVVFLFLFLRRATGALGSSTFVALMFGVHPLHVESVAWIAERKDLLCAVFWFAGLWAYVRYVELPGIERYLLVAGLFSLGLMSKPMIVTFPLLLMVLDVWPLKRGVKLREKLPLLALSALAAGITLLAQKGSGAVESLAYIPLGLRLENALLSYGTYLVETVWPTGLAVFYPFPLHMDSWKVVATGLGIAAISAVVWVLRRERGYLVAGWLWFLGTLVPVIGLVQVGTQAHADRYMYVPMVGLLIMAGWGGAELLAKRPQAALAVGALVGLAMVPVTLGQESYWRNSGTLFEHALAVTEGNSIAEHNLGSYLLDEPGRLPDAILHLRAALRINPDSPSAHSDLGTALAKSGRSPEAIAEFQEALRLKPDSAIAAANLKAAQRDAEQNQAERHYNSGVDLLKGGKPREAVAEFQQALQLKPTYAEAEDDLGIALAQIPGREAEARGHFEAAVKLDPGSTQAHYNLGVALSQMPGREAEALRELEAAYRLKPDPELKRALDQLRGMRK